MATTHPDLTPFGFTPTETAVYFALLRRGPSSGYALAREMSLARANAYQALRGLVAKNAALLIEGSPQRFRAIRADALYARIVEQQARELDQLEADLARAPATGAEPVTRISGRRAVLDLISRTAAREMGPVTILAPLPLLRALTPVLRKRAVDASTTTIWAIGATGELAVPITDAIPESRVREYFPAELAVLLTDNAAMVARAEGTDLMAWWTGDAALRGAVRAAVAALTAGTHHE